jgi:hypothetical protein
MSDRPCGMQTEGRSSSYADFLRCIKAADPNGILAPGRCIPAEERG